MREVFPVRYYKDECFVERKIKINEEDLAEIIEEYLHDHAEFEFDEIELVNNRSMNIWLHAKCRTYIDPDDPDDEKIEDADVQVSDPYHEDDESLKKPFAGRPRGKPNIRVTSHHLGQSLNG